MSSPDSSFQAASHTVMFWLLTSMALAVFAPCVLVPVWADVEEARKYEREMAGIVAELKERIRQNDAQIEALRADPLVNERIARRELNLRPQGEEIVRWSQQELAALRLPVPEQPAAGSTIADEPPDWAKALGRWLPAWPWYELFAKPNNRTLLLLMSAGLLAAAFLLYGGRTASPPAGAASQPAASS